MLSLCPTVQKPADDPLQAPGPKEGNPAQEAGPGEGQGSEVGPGAGQGPEVGPGAGVAVGVGVGTGRQAGGRTLQQRSPMQGSPSYQSLLEQEEARPPVPLTPPQPQVPGLGLRQLANSVWIALKHPSIRAAALFVFVWQVCGARELTNPCLSL